jgi:hypothetical protein
MLTNLQNIKFIGDLSLEDADILAGYEQHADSILEFGSGGRGGIGYFGCGGGGGGGFTGSGGGRGGAGGDGIVVAYTW